jgi:hypothetical protein
MDNLQEVKRLFFVKDNIISDPPYRPTQGRNPYMDKSLRSPIYSIFNQLPNILVILVGDGRSKVKFNIRQRSLARGH